MGTYRHSRKNYVQNLLIDALKRSSPPLTSTGVLPPLSEWLTTRQLATLCGISIYSAGHTLHSMELRGMVIVSPKLISRSLRWYPSNEDSIGVN